MKFLVDLPLGGLAKWLRFCGFDAQVLHLSPGDPKTLPPPQPGTVILTRQEALNRLVRPDILVLAGRGPEEQLQEVFTLLKISRRRLQTLSRCSRCNEPLAPVHRDQVRGRVPEHVFHYQSQFHECPHCHRLFWAGSHLSGIIKTVLEKLADNEEGG